MTNPPPDITVTRDDVLALPTFAGEFVAPGPDDGTVWTLAQALPSGRPVWVAVHKDPRGDTETRFLSRQEATIAERAFLWQTALASDAALADIHDEDPTPRRHVMPCVGKTTADAAQAATADGRVTRSVVEREFIDDVQASLRRS